MLQLLTLNRSQLREHARQWDDLWQRSESRLPTCQAGGIELWCRSFAVAGDLIALVVTRDDRWVAAIPLLIERIGPLRCYRLPNDCTVATGDLLLDSREACSLREGSSEVVAALARHLNELPTGLLCLDAIELHAPRWTALREALAARGRQIHLSEGHEVGVVDVLHDWDGYMQCWSRNHRSAVKRTRKKLEAAGQVQVRRLRKPDDALLAAALERCFEVEDRSWKGDNGTSILKTAGLPEYYHREARWLRDRGMLDVWLLELDGELVAFEYCHFAKGICFSHKISFDPAWERFSPGRLLRAYQLERYHEDEECVQLDTLGVLCEAKAKWATRKYRSGRCLVALGSRWSNLALASARRLRGKLRRKTAAVSPEIEPGAARYWQQAQALSPASGSPLELPANFPAAAHLAPTSPSA